MKSHNANFIISRFALYTAVADLTKYPDETYKLFIVYDPGGRISDREIFKNDFE